MASVISFLVIIILSLLITRIAAVALTHTGLSHAAAKFQARSAFTGVGFTTQEAESVTNHPVRRKIVLLLMLLGNAGIVSAISSLVITFVGDKEGEMTNIESLIIIGVSVCLIWLVSKSAWLNRGLEYIINYALKKYTELHVRDYQRLLNLSGDYEITEMLVEEGDWLAGKSLAETSLREEGIFVLGIQRKDGSYLGVPRGKNQIKVGDTLKLYGRQNGLKELDYRQKGHTGDQAHQQASDEQKEVREKEESADEENDK